MKKRFSMFLTILLTMVLMSGGSVFAFNDIQGDKGAADIIALKKSGILNGVTAEKFVPRGKVTYAQAVQMFVKGFDMKIGSDQFGEVPKASDIFKNVPDQAWYAKAFVTAHFNGLPIPEDVDPNQNMTKEQFAHLLFHAILTKGDFAFIELYVMMKDEADVSPDLMNSIQKLLVSKIAELDNGYFYPKNEITRSEAARMLHKAIQFVKTVEPIPPVEPEEPPVDPDVQMTVNKVNEEVNRVTVSWGMKPNPGYGVSISRIEFTADGEAHIYYVLHEPEPGNMYPQVMTEAKADTYVSTKYKPVLKKGEASGAGSAGFNPDEPASSETSGQ